MEFKFSVTKNNDISNHVRSSNYSSRVVQQILEMFSFGGAGNGTTKGYIDAYTKNALVYMVVNKLCSNAANLPVEYQDANEEEIEISEIEELLENPNPYQSGNEFKQAAFEYLSLSGNVFFTFVEGIGAGGELQVLDTSKVTIYVNSIEEVHYYTYENSAGKLIRYEPEEVLHIRMSSGLTQVRELKFWGVSPLKPLFPIVEASNDLFTARSHIWKNRGYSGILTNKSDYPLLAPERKELQKEFDSEIGGTAKANGVKISSGDLSYLQLGMSPADLKLLEGNIDNLRMIASAYKLPSVLFNDTDNSTYNNMLESKKDAYNDAYIPLFNKVFEKLSIWLSEKLIVDERVVVDVSRIDVLKLTTNMVSNRLNEMSPQSQARIVANMTQEEIRDLVGLDVLGNGSEVIGDATSNNKQDEKETD